MKAGSRRADPLYATSPFDGGRRAIMMYLPHPSRFNVADMSQEQRIPGWCALCRSRCGCISVVRDGRLIAVERNPDHPTGRALCAKGQAAPELVYSPDRILHPMKRTRPKGDRDPGWVRITWDEALDGIASEMRRIADVDGPESIAFAITTPSGTAISDSLQWIERLMRAFGSPNNVYGTEICNWHKDVATTYTFGTGIGTPDLDNTGCIVLWGHNPNGSWLAQGQRVNEAKARGAKLVVVDPRRVGPAAKADQWLRVRPGTDGALALGIAGVMIERGWFDRGFLEKWSNGPFLVHDSERRLLMGADLGVDLVPGGRSDWYVTTRVDDGSIELVDPAAPIDGSRGPGPEWSLDARVEVETRDGPRPCASAFSHYASLCRSYPPARVEAITGVPAAQIEATAALLWSARPVSYYAWSGVGQHTNATQTDRAISLLYALTGSHGGKGGNVTFAAVPSRDVSGTEFVSDAQRVKTLGLDARPLGPAKDGWVTTDDLYRAVLEHDPYPVRGLVAFGSNPLVSHAGVARGIEAFERLELHVHTDLFMTPTAEYADIFLPVTSAWEREALRIGFEISQSANGHVQMRAPVLEPLGEARDDGWIAFELARRLGLGNRFWNGDMDAGYREWLAPSGVSLEALRASPEGIHVPLESRFEPHLERGGFNTPSRRVEIWSETFRVHRQPPLPEYVEPAMGPGRRPDLADRYPLVLSSAKAHQFCHGQHRNLPRLRKIQRDPQAEMHPDAARARGIADGDWVAIETPSGRIRARVKLRPTLAPDVVTAQHGWWQACKDLGLPGYRIASEDSASFNDLIDDTEADPVSGSTAHRAYLCEVRRL